MAEWIYGPVPGMIEPAVAPEFFITDIGGIELVGTCMRVYCIAEQMAFEGEVQRVCNLKIVRPAATLPKFIMRMAYAQCVAAGLEICPADPPLRPRPRVVK